MKQFIFYNFLPSISDHIIDVKYHNRKVHHNYPPFIIDNIKDGDTIFVKTDLLPNFFNIFHLIKNKFILITGVSDLPIDKKYLKYITSNKILKWVGCNILINHEKILKLPIGFQENELPGGNQILLNELYNNKTLFDKKKNKLLLTNTSITHSSRNKINIMFKNSNFVDILINKLEFPKFMKKIDEYKFVLAPRGNGVDTHRFYEILIMGSVPVVESCGLNDLYNNFPCIIVNSFNDINENLLNSYKYDINKKKNIEKYLFTDNIIKLIK